MRKTTPFIYKYTLMILEHTSMIREHAGKLCNAPFKIHIYILASLFWCAATIVAQAQTNVTIGQKPKVEAQKPDAAPHGSTLYTQAEQTRYQTSVTLAYKALLRDSLAQAADYFRQAIDLLPNHPANAEAYYQLGQIALAQGDEMLAAEQFSRSLRIAPTLYKSRKRLADAYLLRADFSAAVKNYNAYIPHAPKDTAAIFLRGYALQQLGSDSLALRDYQSVLTLNPLHADALMGKAVILHRQGHGQQAMADISSLITRFPNNAAYYAVRARMEQTDNRLDAALIDISQAITMEAGNSFYLEQRADIYQQQGKTALAKADRQQARRLAEQRLTTSE